MDQQTIVFIVFQVIVFLFAISVHESAHAWTAYRLGDPTAFMLGRVTLNPVKHIDPVGTILLPAILMFTGAPVFGWAKPTPVNTRHFRKLMRDDILTSVAGPVSNFAVAAISVLLMLFLSLASPQGKMIVRSLVQGAIPPSDSVLVPFAILLYASMNVNIILGVFNLLPLPPLDGSHVLRHFLPAGAREFYDRMSLVSLLLFFLVGGRVIGALAGPVVGFFEGLLLKI